MKTHFSVQLIIAALNEAQGIGPTIAEMKVTLENISILVVDGKSSDSTVEIAKSLGAKVVCQDGFGKGDALAKALEYTDPNVDYIILTDADYTYPAEYIPVMIRVLEANPLVGMVCGNRLTGQVDKEALHSVLDLKLLPMETSPAKFLQFYLRGWGALKVSHPIFLLWSCLVF